MDSLQQVLNNKYFVGFMTVGTVLYASLARPALPQGIANLFEHPITKMLFYALIVLLLTQNLQVALVVAIAFYILMSMLREQRIAEGFIDGLRTEGFFNKQVDALESFYAQQEADAQNQNLMGQNLMGRDLASRDPSSQNLMGRDLASRAPEGQMQEDHERILGRCVDQCLTQNRNNRPENRQEFARRLESCLRREREGLAQGPSYGQMPGQNTGSTQGPMYGQMQGQSTGASYGQTPGATPGTTYGQTTGTTPGATYGQTQGTTYGQTQGTTYGQTQGASPYGQTASSVFSQAPGQTQSQGQQYSP